MKKIEWEEIDYRLPIAAFMMICFGDTLLGIFLHFNLRPYKSNSLPFCIWSASAVIGLFIIITMFNSKAERAEEEKSKDRVDVKIKHTSDIETFLSRASILAAASLFYGALSFVCTGLFTFLLILLSAYFFEFNWHENSVVAKRSLSEVAVHNNTVVVLLSLGSLVIPAMLYCLLWWKSRKKT